MRAALREYFPAALEAFEDFTGADALELLAELRARAAAAKLSRAQIGAGAQAGSPAQCPGQDRSDPDRAAV